MTEGEPILIERVANGFIVNPKEVTSLTENEKDVYVFEDMKELKKFLDGHFNGQKKEGGGAKNGQ